MEYAADGQLDLLARSLQQHIALANQLNLKFTAQLLAMAVIEVTTNIHGISQHELDALCRRIEQGSSFEEKPPAVALSDIRSFSRRSRARRNRSL